MEVINLKTKIIAGLLVLALVATTIGVVSARNPYRFSNPMTADERPIGQCWMNNLTDEQRQEIRQTMQELRESGATREEIRVAIQELMEEMGIDMEENPCMRMDRLGPRGFGSRRMAMKGI